MPTLTQARAARVVTRSKLNFDAVHDPRAYRSSEQQPLAAILTTLVAAFAAGKMVLRSIEDFSADMDKRIRRQMGLKARVSGNRSGGYRCMVTTAANSSRKTGLRPRSGSSCTGSTFLAGPAGALGFTGELAADLFKA